MPNPSLTARVAPSVVARVERCADAMIERAEEGAAPIDRGTVVRRAILLGLPILEAEYGLDRAPTQKSKRAAAAERAPKRKARSLNPTPPNPHKATKRKRAAS